MDDAPKRSLRETITQLIVIAILLALIVGLVIFARQYIDSHNSSDGIAPRSTPTAMIRGHAATRTGYHDLKAS